MRAIDADALIDKYGDWYTEEGTEEGYIGTIKGIVDSIPTIEPERKKGKWGNHGECPFCSYLRQWEDDRFCGNCGADMRGNTKRKGEPIEGNNESYNCENWIP